MKLFSVLVVCFGLVGVTLVPLVSAQSFVIDDGASCVNTGSFGQYLISGTVVGSDATAVIVTATLYQSGGRFLTNATSLPVVVMMTGTPFSIGVDVPACNAVTSYTLSVSQF